MEDSSLLCDINLLAPEHGVDALAQARSSCQFQEQFDCLVGNAVLRDVQVDVGGFKCEALAPPRVLGEERSQVNVPHLMVMLLESLPGRVLCQWCLICRHVSFSPSSVYLTALSSRRHTR